jgi:2-oxo-4-hydroxy-4-carboxy-5-ureidoimidazoline decarboxylase
LTDRSPARTDTALARLNATCDSELDKVLGEVCAGAEWAAAVRGTRPWADAEALLAASETATAALTPAGLADAMAGHARIGRPTPGDAASQREQVGVRGADAALLDELREANAAYEAKFGQVFLICATGRTARTMLDALRERYPNDAATEAGIVRRELGRINALRIRRLLDGGR